MNFYHFTTNDMISVCRNLRPVQMVWKQYSTSYRVTKEILEEYPILNNRQLLPHTYIVDDDLAQAVAGKLGIEPANNSQWIEVNPGPGLLTNALLKHGVQNLCSVEARKDFCENLEKIKQHYGARFMYIRKDFFRSCYIQDKHYELTHSLRDFKASTFVDDPPLRIIMTCGLWEREARLLVSCLHALVKRRYSIYSLGRVQFICFMGHREYAYWTLQHPYPSKTMYRWRTVIQTIFYDVETLMQVPNSCFKPQPKQKNVKIGFLKPEKTDTLYLVRFTPKWNLFEDILAEKYLPMFQFFLKDVLSKRSLRLIPKLDGWFPRIGYDLIKEGFTMSQTIDECTPNDLLRAFQLIIKSPGLEKSSFMSAFLDDHPLNAEHWTSFSE